MSRTPKATCPRCGKKGMLLRLQGTQWVIPSHNLRIAGVTNPECPGTGTPVAQ